MTPCDLSAVHTKSSSSRPRTGPRSPGRGRAHAGAGGCAKSTRTDPSRRRLSRGASRQPSYEIFAATTKIRGVRERSAPSDLSERSACVTSRQSRQPRPWTVRAGANCPGRWAARARCGAGGVVSGDTVRGPRTSRQPRAAGSSEPGRVGLRALGQGANAKKWPVEKVLPPEKVALLLSLPRSAKRPRLHNSATSCQ